MKKTIIIIFIVSLCSIANAQRYLPGMSGFELRVGLSPDRGASIGVGYSQYTRRQNRWVGEVELLQINYKIPASVPLNQLIISGGYYLKFLSNYKKTFFLSGGIAAIVGYETINWNRKTLSDGTQLLNKDSFIYGGMVALEVEYYFSDRLAFLVDIKQRIVANSSVSPFRTQVGIGIKYIINSDN